VEKGKDEDIPESQSKKEKRPSSFNVARLDRELEIKAEEAMVETN